MSSAYYQPNAAALPPTQQASAMLGSSQNTVIISQARQQGRVGQRTANGPAVREEQQVGKYRIVRTIGRGNFARVKLARHVLTGREVAIKIIDKAQFNSSSLQKVYREVRIMRQLDHPNIVKLYEVIDGGRYLYLVIEYLPNGEMFEYIARNGKLKENVARARFRQVVSAVQYVHAKRMVHRDLKAENLLLDADLNVKLCDFGFANDYRPDRKLDTFCGSPPYAAPELYLGQKYVGPEVDVWSMGVILYVMISGTLPFEGGTLQVLRDKVVRGKFRVPFWMSGDCETLVRRCLTVNPSRRANLEYIMINDRWLNIDAEPLRPATLDSGQDMSVDPAVVQAMSRLGFAIQDVIESVKQRKYDHSFATYLILKTTATQFGGLAAIGTVPGPVPTPVSAAPPPFSHPIPLGHPAAALASTLAPTPVQRSVPTQPYAVSQPFAARKVSESALHSGNADGSRSVLNQNQSDASEKPPQEARQQAVVYTNTPQQTAPPTAKPNVVDLNRSTEKHRETTSSAANDTPVASKSDSPAATHNSDDVLDSTKPTPPVLPPRAFRNRPQPQAKNPSKQREPKAPAQKKKPANGTQASLAKKSAPLPAPPPTEPENGVKPKVNELQPRTRRETSVDNLDLIEEFDSRPRWLGHGPKADAQTVATRRHDSYKRLNLEAELEITHSKADENEPDEDTSLRKSKSSLKSDSAMFDGYVARGALPEAVSMNNFSNQYDSTSFHGRKEIPPQVTSLASAVTRHSKKASQANVDAKRVSTKAGYENLSEAVAAESRPTAKVKHDKQPQEAQVQQDQRYPARDKYSSMKKARIIMTGEEHTPTPALSQFTTSCNVDVHTDGDSNNTLSSEEEEAEDGMQHQFEHDSALQQSNDAKKYGNGDGDAAASDENDELPRIYDRNPSRTTTRRSFQQDSDDESTYESADNSEANKYELESETASDATNEGNDDDQLDSNRIFAECDPAVKSSSIFENTASVSESQAGINAINADESTGKASSEVVKSAVTNSATTSDLFLPDLALLAQHTVQSVGGMQQKRNVTATNSGPKSSATGNDNEPLNNQSDVAMRYRRSSAAPLTSANRMSSNSYLQSSASQHQFVQQSSAPSSGNPTQSKQHPQGWHQAPENNYGSNAGRAYDPAESGRRPSKTNLQQAKGDKGGIIDRFTRLFRRAPPPGKIDTSSKGAPHHRSIATVTANEASASGLPSWSGISAPFTPSKSAATSSPQKHLVSTQLRGKQPRVVRGTPKVSKTSTQSADRLFAELMNVLEENGCAYQLNGNTSSATVDLLPFELTCTYPSGRQTECSWLMEVIELYSQKVTAIRCRRLEGDEMRYRGLITSLLNQLS